MTGTSGTSGVLASTAGPMYTIGDAARLSGVSASTLRQWEREGLVMPSRTRGGARRFTKGDVALARKIRILRWVQRLNAAGVRRELKLRPPTRRRGVPSKRVGDDIGPRLRALRLKHGLTLGDVAERSGLSASFISALERSQSGVSVAALERLLAVLGSTVLALLGDSASPPSRLVRASERHMLHMAGGKIRIEQLSRGTALMEPQLFTVAPGGSSEGEYRHEGEEFIFVLDGELDVQLKSLNESYHLTRGDTLYFPSTGEHRWSNPGDQHTVLLWVNTPPTF